MGRFGRYWLPVIIYAAIIFYFSSLPYPLGKFPLFPHADKVIHFFEFGFLGMLLRRALLNTSGLYFRQYAIIWTFVFGVMYGISDEIHQLFVPGRQPSCIDFIFDSIGIAGSLWVRLK